MIIKQNISKYKYQQLNLPQQQIQLYSELFLHIQTFIMNQLIKKILNKLIQTIKFILIIYLVNHLIIDTQTYIQQIVVQNIPTQQANNYNLDSFTMIMCLQKAFICLIAYLVHSLYCSNYQTINKRIKSLFNSIFSTNQIQQNKKNKSSQSTTKNKYLSLQIQTTSNQRQKSLSKQLNNIILYNIPFYHQIWIGFVSFLTIHLVSQIQQKMDVKYMIQWKNNNIIYIFIFIHCFIVARHNWTKSLSCFKSLSLQDTNAFAQLIKSFAFIVLLINARIAILNSSGLQEYYDKILCPFFCRNKDVLDQQAMSLFHYSLILDYIMFGGFFWLRTKYHKINTLQLLMAMTKFTAVWFAIYGLYTGEFLSTMKVIAHVPLILVPLIKLFICNGLVYLLYAYVIMQYSPLIFLSIFLTRGLFRDLQQKYYNNSTPQQVMKSIYYIVGVMLVLTLEVTFNKRSQWIKKNVVNKQTNMVNTTQINQFNENIVIDEQQNLRNNQSSKSIEVV